MHTILTMWFTIVLALSVHMVASELCPGGSTSCARGMTCCELPSGEEGCCPFDNATCCPDKVHCCPNGYDCLSGHCQHASESIYTELSKLMVEYQEPTNRLDDESHQSPNASLMVPANLICPDGHVCRDLGTCCEISENEYGCCPYQDGVCCQNHRTCCPSLYTCSFGGWCVVTIQDNTMAPVKGMSINTICPGGRQTCPAGDTCCPHGYQQWGCCPLLAATCCSDQTHCCPHGYRCNGQGFCTKVDNEN